MSSCEPQICDFYGMNRLRCVQQRQGPSFISLLQHIVRYISFSLSLSFIFLLLTHFWWTLERGKTTSLYVCIYLNWTHWTACEGGVSIERSVVTVQKGRRNALHNTGRNYFQLTLFERLIFFTEWWRGFCCWWRASRWNVSLPLSSAALQPCHDDTYCKRAGRQVSGYFEQNCAQNTLDITTAVSL